MVDIFKNWVSAMLCIGIMVTFIQLIIPKTNLKKYIYSLIGVITIITLIAPAIDLLKNNDVEESVSQVVANISNTDTNNEIDSQEYTKKTEDAVRMDFAQNFKNDISYRLEEKGIITKTIDIFLTDQYNVEKIKINIQKIDKAKSSLADVNNVVKYINEQYDIEMSKIEVVEEGEI